MALGVVSGIYQARSTGEGLQMQTSLLANAVSMQAMQVVEVENDLSAGQKWLRSKKNKNNNSYEEIHNDYSMLRGAPQISQYYRAYKTRDTALALGCLAIHARKRVANLFGIEDVRFNTEKIFHKKNYLK